MNGFFALLAAHPVQTARGVFLRALRVRCA